MEEKIFNHDKSIFDINSYWYPHVCIMFFAQIVKDILEENTEDKEYHLRVLDDMLDGLNKAIQEYRKLKDNG